jgi:hypothetical protein
MAARSAEKLRQAGQEASEATREIMGRGLWVVTQREGAAEGREQFLGLIRDNMEEPRAGASQVLVSAASELSYTWLVFWQEQFAEGMKAAREALERQNAFTRASLERAQALTTQSAELAAKMMIAGSLPPLPESTKEEAIIELAPKQGA